jgi:hypothetical protein
MIQTGNILEYMQEVLKDPYDAEFSSSFQIKSYVKYIKIYDVFETAFVSHYRNC